MKARVAISAPTGEIGRVSSAGVLPWSQFGWVDQQEHVPELTWPMSIRTYSEMRNDSQVQGLYLGITLPIRRYKWVVSPNGSREEVYRNFAQDIKLPVQGEEDRQVLRTRDSFNWDDFLRHALLALAYGFYDFEMVGAIVNGMWRLQDIAPRPPYTVSQKQVDQRGKLVQIVQSAGWQGNPIPANRLVPFCWDREGGNWFGRSILRCMYKHWLLKDRLFRVDAMKNERNGLGVPTIEAPPNASPRRMEDLDAFAQSFRAGDRAGGALPSGAKLRLVGTEGSLPDTLASIQAHDEAMSRSLLMMFLELGQTRTGSRALGESFIDYFALAQETIAFWFEDTMQAYLVEDWVDYNYGPEEPAPRISHERDPTPELAVADLVALIDSGAIVVDPEFESYLRARYLLPKRSGPPLEPPVANPQVAPKLTAPPGPSRRKRAVTASAALPLPDRPLRRQPYEQEVRAGVDFAAMDADFISARNALVTAVRNAQGQQVQELKEKIIAAGNDLTKLAQILCTPIHANAIQERMVQLAQTGANLAITEAARQGKVIAMPDLSNTFGKLSNRAVATDSVLARSLSEAAARKSMSLAGSVKTPQQVATETADYMNGLSTQYLQDQLGGALQQAMNAGRKDVIQSGGPSGIYASELLDTNTCEYCVEVDGTEYPDVDAAEADYPTGGYMDCLGGPRCRGTLVATYGEVETA